MQRFLSLRLLPVISSCSGKNPYLEASLKPAELQGKDKEWFEKNWGIPDGKHPVFLVERPGLTIVLPEERQGSHSSISLPINVRSPSSLTKTKNFPTIPIQAANQLIVRTCRIFSSTTAISYSF